MGHFLNKINRVMYCPTWRFGAPKCWWNVSGIKSSVRPTTSFISYLRSDRKIRQNIYDVFMLIPQPTAQTKIFNFYCGGYWWTCWWCSNNERENYKGVFLGGVLAVESFISSC